jgi:hypothetical protein
MSATTYSTKTSNEIGNMLMIQAISDQKSNKQSIPWLKNGSRSYVSEIQPAIQHQLTSLASSRPIIGA